MRALAIHPGALGDVLLAVPALRRLRAGGPGPLTLAAQPRIGALLGALAVVDRAVSFDALGLDGLFVDAGDAARAAGALAGSAAVVCWFGARDPVFRRRLREIAPVAVIDSPTGDGASVWEHLLETVAAALGPGGGRGEVALADGAAATGDRAGIREPLRVSPALEAAGRAALERARWDGRTPVLLVHPGAGGAAKRWPVEAFARGIESAAARRDLAIAIHEGPADGDAARALAARLEPRLARPILRLEHPELPALAGVLRHVAAWVGNDSGVSHLAAAVGTPALILFAAGNLAWRPWAPAARTLVVETSGPVGADVAAVTRALEAILP